MALTISTLLSVSGYGAFTEHSFGSDDYNGDEAECMDPRRVTVFVGSRRTGVILPCALFNTNTLKMRTLIQLASYLGIYLVDTPQIV